MKGQTPAPSPAPTASPEKPIDLKDLLDENGDPITLNGRVITYKGKEFILMDEITFARVERAVKAANGAAAYIKQLEAEKAAGEKVIEISGKLETAYKLLDEARKDVIDSLKTAIAAGIRAENAEKAAKEIAVKDLDETRDKLKKANRRTIITIIITAVIVAASRL